MKSPGAPAHHKEVEKEFWRVVATGITSDRAAAPVGISQAVGTRWFWHHGGMPLNLPSPLSGRHLSFSEPREIVLLRAQGCSVGSTARQVGQDPSTTSSELRRNAATRGQKIDYPVSVAQWKADLIVQRPKTAKLAAKPELHDYVQQRLSAKVRHLDGKTVSGPTTPQWKGRGKPRRKHRPWVLVGSPEQISQQLKVNFLDDESMRKSRGHLSSPLRPELRRFPRELVVCLSTGRALRVPLARARHQTWAHVTPEVMIIECPAEADDRAVSGHWESDLLIGIERPGIGTLVERVSRFTILVHLLREYACHHQHSPKNGPALAGYGAITM